MRASSLAVLMLATAMLIPQTADARPRGHVHVMVDGDWYGGFGAMGTKVAFQTGGPELLEDGVGFHLYGGVRLSRFLAVEAQWMESFHNPAEVDLPSNRRHLNLIFKAGLWARLSGKSLPWRQIPALN